MLLPFETLTFKGTKKLIKEKGIVVVVLEKDPVFLHHGKIVEPVCCSYFCYDPATTKGIIIRYL